MLNDTLNYIAPLFGSVASAEPSKVLPAAINSFHWEKVGFSRPESYFKLYGVHEVGLFIRMWSFEKNVRCECVRRDEPVYTDSCLELFIKPFKNDSRYVNFEVNKNGVYLSEIGEKRENRTLIKELTALEPQITPISVHKNKGTAWGFDMFISDSLISELFDSHFCTEEGVLQGNFYKCADLSRTPHFAARFPVASAELGFHNPSCFGNIILRKA